MGITFTIMTEENTATVTLSNPYTGKIQIVLTGIEPQSIAYAIACFAIRERLLFQEVNVSVVYPTRKEPE